MRIAQIEVDVTQRVSDPPLPADRLMQAVTVSSSAGRDKRLLLADRAAILYVYLWILEGALRKWGPSGLGTPLYFFRDVAVMAVLTLVVLTMPRLRSVPKVIIIVEFTVYILGATQLIFGSLPVAVALVGVRQFIGPLAFIHLILGYASADTFRKIGNILIYFVPLECAISLLQALSPASSWINAVGPDAYTRFFTANGVVRTSGTYTAAYGLVCYIALTAAIVVSRRGEKPANFIERSALPFLCLMALISGSRSVILFLALALTVNMIMMAGASRGPKMANLIKGAAAIGVGITVAILIAPNVLVAFRERSENAEQTQSSTDRINQQAFAFLSQIPRVTAIGSGLGANSAAGIAAGSGQPWIEDELGRWIHEAGILGLIAVAMREIAAPCLLLATWRLFRRDGDRQPFVVSCVFVPSLVAGLVNTQPSQQGFAAIAVALATFRLADQERESAQ